MRGTLFQHPLEWGIDVQGERWAQGEKVTGLLRVTNHGTGPVSLADCGVALAVGGAKKVKVSDPKAFQILQQELFLNTADLSGTGQVKELPWSFDLAQDCAITDKSGSLYILYGRLQGKIDGHLLLTVLPKPAIQRFIEIFENFHRFKAQEPKFKKGQVEFKMVPPKSRDFATVDGLSLGLREVDKNLEVSYRFQVKNLAYGGHTIQDVKMEKKEVSFEQVLSEKQYLFHGSSPNQEGILQATKEILERVKAKSLP